MLSNFKLVFYNIPASIVPLNNDRMRVGKDNYTIKLIYIESVFHKHKKGYQNMSFFK